MNESHRLSLRIRLGYGVTEYGLVLTWQVTKLFLLLFLTEEAGLEPATAGALIFIGLLWDAATDLFMGVVVDRTRTRYGRFKPYLLCGAPILAVAFSLQFFDWQVPGVGAVAAFLFLHLAFRTSYTIVAIPHGALSSAMTSDTTERARLIGTRIVFSALSALTVAMLFLPMTVWLNPVPSGNGYARAALLVGLTSAVLVIVGGSQLREDPVLASQVTTQISVRSIIASVAANSAFLQVGVSFFLFCVAQTVLLLALPYLVLTSDQGLTATLALSILIGGVVLFLPIWMHLARTISKRTLWFASVLWTSVSLAGLLYAFSASGGASLALAVMAFGVAGLQLTGYSMAPDTVEYGAFVNGQRVEAPLFSAFTFAQKAGTGMGALILGLLLSQTQSETGGGEYAGSATYALPLVMVFLIATLPIMARYPLTIRLHGRLVVVLNAGRRRVVSKKD